MCPSCGRASTLAALVVSVAVGCGPGDVRDTSSNLAASTTTTADSPDVGATSTAPVIMTNPTTANGPPAATATTVVPTEPEETMTSTPGPKPTSVPASIVDLAIADLAERLGIDPAEVDVVSAREVTWPDSSLGCPDPRRTYTQALVNGSLIVLTVGGVDHEYHAGRSGEPFYCPPERATPPASGADPTT